MNLRVVHRLLGLTISFYLISIVITGVALSFRDAALEIMYSEHISDATYDVPESLKGLFQVYTNPIKSIKLNEFSSKLWLVKSPTGSYAYYSPSSKKLIDTFTWYENPIFFLKHLHVQLLMGSNGRYVNATLAILLVLLLAVGIKLSRSLPKQKSLTSLIKSNRKLLVFSRLHDQLGLVLSIPLVFMVCTALAIIFLKPAIKKIYSTNMSEMTQEYRKIDMVDVDWAKLLEIKDATQPDSKVIYIYPPKSRGSVVFRNKFDDEVHPNGRSYVKINPYNYKVTMSLDAREQSLQMKFAYALYPLHSGKFEKLSALYKILFIFVALLTVFVSFSGWWVYSSKRKSLGRNNAQKNPSILSRSVR